MVEKKFLSCNDFKYFLSIQSEGWNYPYDIFSKKPDVLKKARVLAFVYLLILLSLGILFVNWCTQTKMTLKTSKYGDVTISIF